MGACSSARGLLAAKKLLSQFRLILGPWNGGPGLLSLGSGGQYEENSTPTKILIPSEIGLLWNFYKRSIEQTFPPTKHHPFLSD